jgi:two-component system NtrC family sensor kinase
VDVGVRHDHAASPRGCEGFGRDWLCLFVRDEGKGISAEHAERLFEPFFTTKEVGEGTGLGLSIAHGIIRDHGGWIGVASEPGKGSCFSVYLPQEELGCEGES